MRLSIVLCALACLVLAVGPATAQSPIPEGGIVLVFVIRLSRLWLRTSRFLPSRGRSMPKAMSAAARVT
jgi:hypothetical protein